MIVFSVVFALSMMTFQNQGLSAQNPLALFIIYFIVNGAMLLIYVIMQIVLVLNTLDDRWPLGK